MGNTTVSAISCGRSFRTLPNEIGFTYIDGRDAAALSFSLVVLERGEHLCSPLLGRFLVNLSYISLSVQNYIMAT